MPWVMFQLLIGLVWMVAQTWSDAPHVSSNSEPGDLVEAGKTEPPGTATSGVDVSALDPKVDPCVDFYQYACGNWRVTNPIPSDRSHWGRFAQLRERNLDTLRNILEHASIDDPNRSVVEQKIGDYYAACMDETIHRSKRDRADRTPARPHPGAAR